MKLFESLSTFLRRRRAARRTKRILAHYFQWARKQHRKELESAPPRLNEAFIKALRRIEKEPNP